MRTRSRDSAAVSIELPPFEPEWATPVTDAGYRPLRRLPDDIGGYLARSRDGTAVLVEVIGADDGAEQNRLARVLAALDRLDHPHVQKVIDVGDGTGASIVLVTAPVPARTLAGVLARRRRLSAGEVVTLLAPLAAALRHCHEHGVVHGSIAPMAVGLTEAGLPFWSGFESAALVDGRRDRRALIAADVTAFSGLAERCWPAGAAAAPNRADGLDEIERMLFELAAPEPIRMADVTAEPPEAVDVREALTTRSSPPPEELRRDRGPDRARPAAGGSIDDRIRSVLGLLERRRGPVIVGLSVVVAGVIALTALPAANAGPGPSAPIASPTASTPTGAGESGPAGTAAAPTTEASMVADGVDVATAADALRAALSRCADPNCARRYLTADSPLRAAGPESWAPFAATEPGTLTVSDRNGDAAVIGFSAGETATASALIVRTEAGWLLRDVFAAG